MVHENEFTHFEAHAMPMKLVDFSTHIRNAIYDFEEFYTVFVEYKMIAWVTTKG